MEDIERMRSGIFPMVEYIDTIDSLEFLDELLGRIREYIDEVEWAESNGEKVTFRSIDEHPSMLELDVVPLIQERIVRLTPDWYMRGVVTSESEKVNGYALFDVGSWEFPKMSFAFYMHLCKVWDDDEWLSKDEFMKRFEAEACTDWNKMDEHGECFGGYWKSSNPQTQENAYELSRLRNREMLWRLPYPRKFLIETVRLGCKTRCESVRHSNHFGVWLQRMREKEMVFTS